VALNIERRIKRLEERIRTRHQATLALLIRSSQGDQAALEVLQACDPESELFILVRGAVETHYAH